LRAEGARGDTQRGVNALVGTYITISPWVLAGFPSTDNEFGGCSRLGRLVNFEAGEAFQR
jgi:hypothetical protein